jgi:signal transduction histidine kinase
MAHEIRNPLMSLGGFASRLKRKLPEVAELGIIVQESERLEKILGRIEDYLKPVEMHPTECSVNRTITEALRLLSDELGEEGISLELELSPELPPAYADQGIFMQVLIDVVRKTLRVMNKKERITIGTSEGNQNIHIYVRAPVSGVKIKDPEHLLLPFGEDDFSLAVCFRMLRAMGGFVSLKQEKDTVVFSATLLKASLPNTDDGTRAG